jgi:RNA polymerase sigma-70 factor (ECF subfamily)
MCRGLGKTRVFGRNERQARFFEILRHPAASQCKLLVDLHVCPTSSLLLDQPQQRLIAGGLRAGDRAAWGTLFDAYSTPLWRFALRLIGKDDPAIDDVVQETFLAAAKSARQFDAEQGTLWAWLTGIAQRQAALYWRQAARAARIKTLAAEDSARIQDWLVDTVEPDTPWEQRETADLIRSVLAELNADYAALLTARYLDERATTELVEMFGGTADSLKSKLARARKEFRHKFELITREPVSQTPPLADRGLTHR